jgi:hypothetical protein
VPLRGLTSLVLELEGEDSVGLLDGVLSVSLVVLEDSVDGIECRGGWESRWIEVSLPQEHSIVEPSQLAN